MTPLLMKRQFWFWVLTVATGLFFSSAYFVIRGDHQQGLPLYGKVEDFKLTERSGETITNKALQGHLWIADFIFTRCAGICPMMSSRMRLLQEKLKDHPEIHFVSFSVDPEYDTPEVLAKYAKHFNADSKKWLFLTGDKDQIFKLSRQHFYLAVGEIPEGEREAPDQSVDHSSKFALVDTEGNIRAYYNSEDPDFVNQIARDVQQLETHKGPGSSDPPKGPGTL